MGSWCYMQKDLLKKQIMLVNQCLINKQIQNVYILDGFTQLFEFPNKQFLSLCQKAPHLGVFLLNDEKELTHLKTMPHENDKSLKGLFFRGLTFNEVSNTLIIHLDYKDLLFEMAHNGQKKVIEKEVFILDPSLNIEFTFEEKEAVQKYISDLLAYLFKEVRNYFSKIKKQINLFKHQLDTMPGAIASQQEAILFILEHQREIEAKDKQYLSLFEKHKINFLHPFGIILKKAYKAMHKLEKQKEFLPKLILSYEKKLQGPYIAPQLKTEAEKVEKKKARVFYTSLNEKIKVAKSDKDADVLTFKEAHGNYTWLHVDNYPGAHTVIFSSNPSDEALNIARYLAKYYSKAKDTSECDVIETQVKFLKKGKKPGEVYVSKKNVVQVKHDTKLELKLFPKFT